MGNKRNIPVNRYLNQQTQFNINYIKTYVFAFLLRYIFACKHVFVFVKVAVSMQVPSCLYVFFSF